MKLIITLMSTGGVGGDRPLVQTMSNQGFYMLSLRLVFDEVSDKDTQKLRLSSKSHTCLEASQMLSCKS